MAVQEEDENFFYKRYKKEKKKKQRERRQERKWLNRGPKSNTQIISEERPVLITEPISTLKTMLRRRRNEQELAELKKIETNYLDQKICKSCKCKEGEKLTLRSQIIQNMITEANSTNTCFMPCGKWNKNNCEEKMISHEAPEGGRAKLHCCRICFFNFKLVNLDHNEKNCYNDFIFNDGNPHAISSSENEEEEKEEEREINLPSTSKSYKNIGTQAQVIQKYYTRKEQSTQTGSTEVKNKGKGKGKNRPIEMKDKSSQTKKVRLRIKDYVLKLNKGHKSTQTDFKGKNKSSQTSVTPATVENCPKEEGKKEKSEPDARNQHTPSLSSPSARKKKTGSPRTGQAQANKKPEPTLSSPRAKKKKYGTHGKGSCDGNGAKKKKMGDCMETERRRRTIKSNKEKVEKRRRRTIKANKRKVEKRRRRMIKWKKK